MNPALIIAALAGFVLLRKKPTPLPVQEKPFSPELSPSIPAWDFGPEIDEMIARATVNPVTGKSPIQESIAETLTDIRGDTQADITRRLATIPSLTEEERETFFRATGQVAPTGTAQTIPRVIVKPPTFVIPPVIMSKPWYG